MKRLVLFLLAATISIMASAQYVNSPQGTLTARGAKIYSDGVKLTTDQSYAVFSDFGGQDRGGEYLSNRKGYMAGVGLSVGGASLVAVGLPASYVATAVAVAYGLASAGGAEVPAGVELAVYSTYGATIAGALIMLAGIPTASVYQHRIKKMTRDYNDLSSSYSEKPMLTFGPASSGIGIAMSF